MSTDTDHLAALYQRLINERERLSSAKTEKEKSIRSVYVEQIEKEIKGEKEFLGIVEDDIDDDDLLAQLLG